MRVLTARDLCGQVADREDDADAHPSGENRGARDTAGISRPVSFPGEDDEHVLAPGARPPTRPRAGHVLL